MSRLEPQMSRLQPYAPQVRKATDVAAALRRTRADGAMVAEPLLRYPALLSAAAEERCVAPLTADQTD